MVKVSDVAALFHEEKFVQFTLLSEGQIALTVGGSLQGKADQLFRDLCRDVVCVGSIERFEADTENPHEETWLLAPKDGMRAVLCETLIRAWRHYVAGRYNPAEAATPPMAFNNVNGEGWGEMQGRQTHEQAKSVLLLLALRHKVRVYHDQAAARAAGYGPPIAEDEGYIALDIDGWVFLCTPSGYFHRTTIGAGTTWDGEPCS